MGYMPKFFTALLSVLTAGLLLFPQQVVAEKANSAKVVINIPSRTLSFYEGGQVVKEYPIGIGRPDSQTPVGTFKVFYKEFNPVWIEPTEEGKEPRIIPSGPNNPLGYRWMEFAPYYGIHGTNNPDSIGGYVSGGCVRMLEADVEELYEKVPLGMPVEITYERLVVKEASDRSITLFVYPDTYGKQALDTASVYKKLRAYQAEDLVGRSEVEAALRSGKKAEIRVGRVFSLTAFGKKLPEKGFSLDGADYVPVIPVAAEAKVDVVWNAAERRLTSTYGFVPGIVRNDRLYVKTEHLHALLHLYARWYPMPDTLYMDHYMER